MPEPLRSNQRYMPGLDGLRALAVSAVIAYHLGLGWASGGLLGVGVFFTLSGYLITDLLLAQREQGRLRLADFWRARARRLLPALFLMLLVVSIWVSIADRSQMGAVRGQVFAAALYISNWWQSFQHISYFARFGPPSPLNHLWSLSIEEQFYVLWPWLLLLGVHFVRERRRSVPVRPRLAAWTLLLALVSALEMAILFRPTFDPSRIYYGTDTRAFGLLLGAALAMVWPSRSLTRAVGARAGDILDVVGVLGLVVIGVLVWRTNEYSAFMYRGGMVLLSLATVMVLAALTHPATRLGRALGWGPLRWVGVRSYGLYLWHAPIIVLTTPTANREVQPLRAVLQVLASVAVAGLSWRFVEEPIRHGALGRLWAQAKAANWSPRLLSGRVNVAVGAVAATCLLAALALAGVRAPSPVRSLVPGVDPQPVTLSADTSGGGVFAPGTGPAKATTSAHRAGARTTAASSSATTAAASGATTATAPLIASLPGADPPSKTTGSQPLRTSCKSVVHIGDSTSEGMISSDYLPDPSQRLAAQYARVGVHDSRMEISGGTSIVETLPGQINAYTVTRDLVSGGYRGCWVIALGTNDTADIYVGSSVSLATRIRKMMSVIGDDPVMWVNAKTLSSSGPYSESDMQRWNQALLKACSQYPNMRVYDWASAAKDKWFIPDGIHYYSPGYAARAHLIANALAESFPASGGSPPGCVVSTGTISLPVLGVH
jgi:peptidoglycan/LPS O-acetylase OafA/YrhL